MSIEKANIMLSTIYSVTTVTGATWTKLANRITVK